MQIKLTSRISVQTSIIFVTDILCMVNIFACLSCSGKLCAVMDTLVDQDASTNFVIWSNKLCHATAMIVEDFVQCLTEASCSQIE